MPAAGAHGDDDRNCPQLQAADRIDVALVNPSPAGMTRGSIFFLKALYEADGLPGQARQ
jgi:hypothetical protein